MRDIELTARDVTAEAEQRRYEELWNTRFTWFCRGVALMALVAYLFT